MSSDQLKNTNLLIFRGLPVAGLFSIIVYEKVFIRRTGDFIAIVPY